ncbi:hypothetical protein FISHEDRAFT_59269 [Fistulina hepatica ATCC 64428]|uniref:Uncharacterized protein n=1 Tax=Fistulina hepatica ATCC 64428 TaxID=1128425 RepID=A0A0D7AAD6_9AGAR|nr:hypothetical protein FISHEDRAFT_59269 [Fistulina hepatica ATCC 64428]
MYPLLKFRMELRVPCLVVDWHVLCGLVLPHSLAELAQEELAQARYDVRSFNGFRETPLRHYPGGARATYLFVGNFNVAHLPAWSACVRFELGARAQPATQPKRCLWFLPVA